jgi:hypothetical protein
VLAVLVILGTLFVVYRADFGAVKATGKVANQVAHPTAYDQDAGLKRQFTLLIDELRSQVPTGHSIYLDHLNDPTGLWTQRIVEFAAMARILVVPDAAHADYAVTIVPDGSAPSGVRLVARPVR